MRFMGKNLLHFGIFLSMCRWRSEKGSRYLRKKGKAVFWEGSAFPKDRLVHLIYSCGSISVPSFSTAKWRWGPILASAAAVPT